MLSMWSTTTAQSCSLTGRNLTNCLCPFNKCCQCLLLVINEPLQPPTAIFHAIVNASRNHLWYATPVGEGPRAGKLFCPQHVFMMIGPAGFKHNCAYVKALPFSAVARFWVICFFECSVYGLSSPSLQSVFDPFRECNVSSAVVDLHSV